MVICCLPVFYVATVLAPFPFAVMMEDLDFTSAFNRCFQIIKNNFWISLATYIVAAMIYYFSTLIIGAVIGLLAGLGTYFTTRDFGTTMGIVTSILNIFSSMFSMVLVISIALNYFNLTEQFDGTGIMRKIDNLGSTENNNFDNIDEQY
jgi:predicted PurR-regulated permease PerM